MRAQRSVNDTIAWLRAGHDPEAIAGVAFLVSPHLALTCAHVVRDHLALGKPTPRQLPTATIRLRFEGLRMDLEARVAPSGWWPGGDDDDVQDIAVLELLTPLTEIKLPALAVFPASEVLECEIYGTIGGYETIGQIVYAQMSAKPGWRGWHQIDARAGRESSYFVRQGFSGAPVLDALGNTIWGMVATIETEPGKLVAFAIAPEHLKVATGAVLQAAGARREQVEPPREPGPLDALAREALATLLGEDLESKEPSPERIEELRSALRDLAERGRKPANERSIAAALEQLKRGERADAEAVFAGLIQQRRNEGKVAYSEAAEAARHLGAIAYLDNTSKAIEAYRTAAELDPADTWTWIHLGRLRQRAGDLAAAEHAFAQARAVAEQAHDERDAMAADNGLGDVRVAVGDLSGALAAYEAALAIAEKLAGRDPNNAEWQRDLSVSYDRIGDVRVAHGDRAGALAAYEQGLAIREKLAGRDPNNARWQRDLSVSYHRIGDARLAQGDRAGARAAYEQGLAIHEELAGRDPNNAEWQRDLSVNLNKSGDVRVAQGDRVGALAAYEQGRAIAEKLAGRDPNNAEWQRDLSVSFERIGDVRVAQGDRAGALEAYEQGRAIHEKLTGRDPNNAQWQRDLSVSLNKIGDVRVEQGDRAGALEAYEQGLAIHEKLAGRDPNNAEWQRDLSVSFERIGDVRVAQGDRAGALEAYEQDLAIREKLAGRDPNNAEWQRDLIVSYVKLAEVGTSASQSKSHYELAVEIVRRLHENGRLAPVDHWMLGDLGRRIAALSSKP